MIKAPRFWISKNWVAVFLLPFSFLYYFFYRLRIKFATPEKLPIPVICIGNLTLGGAGKTPVCLAIGSLLKERGINAFFISKGYGGKQKQAVKIDLSTHNSLMVGDESLLLAGVLPTIVGKNRVEAAKLAVKHGAEIIIMDDGFQNPTIFKDLAFIVVDRKLSFGNEFTFPAGPLREPVKYGIKRADALIVINPANFLPTRLLNIPFIIARSHPKASMLKLKGQKIIAFCGIANPKKFFRMLENVNAEVKYRISFPDHHHYTESELSLLGKRAENEGAKLVTTSKDAVRLPEYFKKEVEIAEMELIFENMDKLNLLLKNIINV